MEKRLPYICPSCSHKLKVKSLQCEHCGTSIDGLFDLPVQAKLDAEDQDFIINFVKLSGSLKEMAKLLGLSYPTVRNKLDDLIERLKDIETQNQ